MSTSDGRPSLSEPPYRQPGRHGNADEPTRAYRPADDATQVYRQPTGPAPREQEYRQPREEYRPPSPGEMRRRSLDPGALWSGGVVTAIVAALVALAGIIVIRGIIKIDILTSLQVGTFGNAKTVVVVAVAFAAAIVATGILHALLLTTPTPITFFGWITALVTVIIALLPLTTTAPWDRKLATVVLYVVIGLVIGLLLSGAARRARPPRPAAGAAVPPLNGSTVGSLHYATKLRSLNDR